MCGDGRGMWCSVVFRGMGMGLDVIDGMQGGGCGVVWW